MCNSHDRKLRAFSRQSASRGNSTNAMTAMIDVVFLLLVFFVMTFQVVALEGQFEITAPTAARCPQPSPADAVPPIRVELSSDGDGQLASIQLAGETLSSTQKLREKVASIVRLHEQHGSVDDLVVQLVIDDQLLYQHTMDAMTAIRGTAGPDGTIEPLISRIQFQRG